MANDLSTEDSLKRKLKQVYKEAFAMWHKNGECVVVLSPSLMECFSHHTKKKKKAQRGLPRDNLVVLFTNKVP